MEQTKTSLTRHLNDSSKDLVKKLEEKRIQRLEWLARHPVDPPNSACHHAFIKGLSLENSFAPSVGDYIPLFGNKYETVYSWTHKKDTNSALIVDVSLSVKNLPLWRTLFSTIRLALRYFEAFEGGLSATDHLEYKWIYYFDPQKSNIAEATIYNISEIDRKFITDGRIIKASLLADLSPLIELFQRDERAYTAVALLNASFDIHYFCLICALSNHPFHDHISEEPEIWEHLEYIPNLETAIVNACRSVESILGAPPSRNNRSSLLRHKENWGKLVGIDPDSYFENANKTYLEFYYDLFFDLRNPSAHSYGYIHYNLERSKAVQAQCFAALIVRGYIELHELSEDNSKSKLNFNQNLLDRISEEMSTPLTKESQEERGFSV